MAEKITETIFQEQNEKYNVGADWCNPKNLNALPAAVAELQRENIEVAYTEEYLHLNLINLLSKTKLSKKERWIVYFELREAWQQYITRIYSKPQEDDPFKFREKGIRNLFYLDPRLKFTKLCKKIRLKDGAISFLDDKGAVLVSFSLDLKSETRKRYEKLAVERGFAITAAQEERKQLCELTQFVKINDNEYEIGDSVSKIIPTGKDFYNLTHAVAIQITEDGTDKGEAKWNEGKKDYFYGTTGGKLWLKHRKKYRLKIQPKDQKKQLSPAPSKGPKPAVKMTGKPGGALSMQQLPNQPEWFPHNLHITIDDGPRLTHDKLPKILAALNRYKVKATFFFVGKVLRMWMKGNAQKVREDLRKLVESGHRIGYHSMNHCHKPTERGCGGRRFDQFSKKEIMEDFAQFQKVVDEALGYHYTITVGRMPGGSGTYKPHVIAAFREVGLEDPKFWHDTDKEWKKGLKTAPSYASAVTDKKGQHIILLHEYGNTGGQINQFLSTLKDQNEKIMLAEKSTQPKVKGTHL